MTDKEIQLKLEEIVFEEIIAPNCATCSDAISGHPNKCDNGINCMSKLLNGEFINYKKIKDLDQNKALKAENKYDIRRKTIKEVAKNIDLLRKNQFEGKSDPTFRAVFSVLSSMYQSHGWENGIEGLFE